MTWYVLLTVRSTPMDETPMALLPVHVYSPRSDAVTSLMFSMVRYGKAPLMVAVVICKEMISTCALIVAVV